jgi:3-hydroxyisobutyrate dehydrogenase-like beta-hydroxyacid dehydrogenase
MEQNKIKGGRNSCRRSKVGDTPKEIAEKCDFIFTMVSDGPTLQSVTLSENGVVAGLSANKIVIDMSTVSPEESAKVNDAIEAKDCKFIRGP